MLLAKKQQPRFKKVSNGTVILNKNLLYSAEMRGEE
jgi:hypothetical protein